MIKAPWRALSALALIAAIGCGDDDGTEPEGSISVSASPSTLTVQQGASGTVTVTLTRGGGFSEPVNVTVEGLPTGATATVSPSSLTGTTTQAVVTVTVANSVAAGNYPVTIRASAAGIGAATAQYTLTVTAAPTANYALSATAASVAQGGSGTSTISIARTNFTGAVALTLDNPPAGITGTFNPASATGDNSVLTINVAGTVAPGTQNLTVKGTAAGQTDKTTTVALTVTAAQAANYTLSATPAALTINAGGNSTTTVNIARTNFTGTVNLTLDAPPAGITATFNPAAATGNTSTATINVAGTVAPGNHTLTIKGTATGIADKTTTVTLTVAAAAGFTIAASPTALTIAPGANQTSSISIVRTNFTTDVALSLVNPPAGITGTFTPATLTGTTLTSSLQVNVAGTVQPGTYPLTVQGVGGSVTQTATINLTVPAAGSTVTLAMQPTSLSIQQGASGSATLNLTRTNFTGNVTPSVTGNPAGMTVTFNPNPITGNSAQVTVNVGASVPAATYPLTITGAAGAAGNPTTTLSVQVTAQSGGQNLTWDFCTADGVPLKFWRLSGTTWAEVTPTVVGNVTRFSFSIASTSGGVAYTMQASAAAIRSRAAPSKLAGMISRTKMYREKTQAAMRLTNQALPQVSNYFDTVVQLGLTSELAGYAEVCGTTTSTVSKTFNVSNMGATETGQLGYGPGATTLVPTTASYNLNVQPGTYDWAAVFGPAPALPDFSSSWTAYRIGRGEVAPGAAVSVNRTGATAFVSVPFTVTGAPAGSINLFSEFIEGARGPIVGFSLGSPFSTATSGNMLFLAASDRLATDLTSFNVTNLAQSGSNTDLRFQTRYFGTPPASATFTLPTAVPAFTVTQVNGAPVTTWSATGPIPAEYQTAISPVSVTFEGNGGTALVTVSATRGWLLANNMTTTYTLTQPTLPNFLSQWAPAAPLASAVAIMLGFDELAAPTAGTTLNFAARLQAP